MTDDTPYRPAGQLDPVAAAIAEFFAADPVWNAMTERPIVETRAAVRAMTPVSGEPAMQRVEDHAIPVAGGTIALRVYSPASSARATILWAHGGGFALGSIDEIDNFARALAIATGCVIASVEYRLAPEHKFPTAVDDMQAAAQWVAARHADWAGATVPLLLGGDSAGANLATVVTRRLHAAQGPRIAGNILAYPCTEGPQADSLRHFASPFLGVEQVSWFLEQYLPDATSRSHPDFAPLLADDLAGLPPTLVITAEHDIITQQAEAYGHRLRAAGVPVTAIRHAGMIHGFLTMDAFFPGAAGTAMRDIAEFVATLAG